MTNDTEQSGGAVNRTERKPDEGGHEVETLASGHEVQNTCGNTGLGDEFVRLSNAEGPIESKVTACPICGEELSPSDGYWFSGQEARSA